MHILLIDAGKVLLKFLRNLVRQNKSGRLDIATGLKEFVHTTKKHIFKIATKEMLKRCLAEGTSVGIYGKEKNGRWQGKFLIWFPEGKKINLGFLGLTIV